MQKGKKVLGKTYALLNKYENVKIQASTINFVNLKSINIDVKFWIDKVGGEETKKQIDKIFKDCKRTFTFESGGFYHTDKVISIANYPDDLSSKTNKAFVLLEFTIFPNIYFKDDMHLIFLLSELGDRIFNNVFKDKDNITISKKTLSDV
jgi:hypothetical protein